MGFEVDIVSAADLFQANGVAEWTWPIGDPTTYQNFSVKPEQFNCNFCEITAVSWSRANDPRSPMIAHITVNLQYTSGGGLLIFYVMGAPSR